MRPHRTTTKALAASVALLAIAAGKPEGAGTPPDETRVGDDAVVCIVSHDVLSVTVRSTKALGNVQLVFADGATEKFEDPDTEVHEATYAGTGDNLDSPITAVHVKSGDNNHGARGLGALVEDVCAPAEQPAPPTDGGVEEDQQDGKLIAKPTPTPPAEDEQPAPQPPVDTPPAPQPPVDTPPAPQPPVDTPPVLPGPPTPENPVGLPSTDLPPDHAGVPPHVEVPDHVVVPKQPDPVVEEPQPEPVVEDPQPEPVVEEPQPEPVVEPEPELIVVDDPQLEPEVVVVDDPQPEPVEPEPTVEQEQLVEEPAPVAEPTTLPGPEVASGNLERDLVAAPAVIDSEDAPAAAPVAAPAAEPASETEPTVQVSAGALANAGADAGSVATVALLALLLGTALLRRRPTA